MLAVTELVALILGPACPPQVVGSVVHLVAVEVSDAFFAWLRIANECLCHKSVKEVRGSDAIPPKVDHEVAIPSFVRPKNSTDASSASGGCAANTPEV
jgi:hypothetical protein